MVITHLGERRLQGLKLDRVNDSLGADGDGTNTEITPTRIKVNTTTNKVEFDARRGAFNHALSYDLGTTLSNTAWTLRYKLTFTTLTQADSTARFYIALSDLSSSSDSNQSHDALAMHVKINASLKEFHYMTTDGGSLDIEGTTSSVTPTETTYYITMTRKTATTWSLRITTSTDYTGGTLHDNISCASGTDGLQYLWMGNVNASGTEGARCIGTIEDIKIDDGSTTFSSADYTINPNSTTGWTGQYKLGTGAYSLNGTSSHVTVGSTSDWNFVHDGSGATVSAWVYRNGSQTGNGGIFVTEGGQSTTTGFGLGIRSGGNAYARTINTGNSWQVCEDTSSSVSTGVWHHILATIDSTSIKLYVDGTLNSSHTISGTLKSGNSSYRAVGRAYSGSAWSYLNGKLDDMGIWKRVLTATEISDLVNQSSPNTTSSGGTLNITSGGSTVLSTIDVGTTSDTKWVLRYKANFGTWSANSYFHVCLSNNNNPITSSQDELGVFYRNDSSSNNFGVHTVAGANPNSVNSQDQQTWSTSTSTDYYFEIVRESSTSAKVKFYGTDSTYTTVSSTSSYTSVSANCDGLDRIKIMENNASNTSGAVTISDIKFWNGVTSVSNDGALVSSLSNKAGLKAHYTMDAISGALSGIAPDDGGNANSYGGVSLDSTNKILGSNSYDFSGSSSGVVGNSNQSYGISGTASWTISCWLRFHSVTGSGNEAIFRKQVNNGDSEFEFGANSSNIFAWIEGHTTNIKSSPANNTWYHIVIRRVSGDKDYFYLNGVEVANTSTQNSIDDPSGFRWYLGRRKESNNEPFEGNMDEWGIWNRALTTSEITALYNSGDGAKVDSISTTDLVIYWNFEQIPLAQQALPKCSNDFSSTSDLVAMTNLPTNTIFEQIDDTPAYYWKQSDNTWALDYHTFVANAHKSTGDGLYCGGAGGLTNNTSLATNYVWATNSANLPNNLGYSAGGGYKSSFQACGGYIASGSFFDSSTIWNGTAWATAVALDTQRRDTTAYGGSPSSAIIALGRNNSGTEIDSSSKWNGTAWSSAGAVGSEAGEHVGGDGSDTSMLITGGSRGKEADKWNGSSWSATTALPQDTSSHNHAGKNADSAHVAGGNGAYAYDWDGTTWTSVTAITLGSDTTPRYVSGGGNKDHHWVMCGLDGGTSMNNCTLWNGSSWTAKGNMTESQYGGLGDGTIR